MARSPTVGLDIGSTSARAVALRRTWRGWSLAAAAAEPLPEGVGADGPSLGARVARLLAAMPGGHAVVALAGHALIVKRLALPPMSPGELDEAIRWEAQQHVPFDTADVRIAWHVSGARRGGVDRPVPVLLVAARRDRIEERVALVTGAGRETAVVDVEAFALVNAYRMNYPERRDPHSALVHIGHRLAIVCVLEHGEPAVVRDVSIRRPANPSMDERPGTGTRTDPDLVPELADHIRSTLDLVRPAGGGEPLRRVVISGGGCQTPGLIDGLAAHVRVPVELHDPFRRVARAAPPGAPDPSGPSFAIAVGLAMRQERRH